MYKVKSLNKENCVLAFFASEGEATEEYSSLEKLLQEDGCLPEGIDPPKKVPSARKCMLFFDLNEGVCYAYSPGMAPPVQSLFSTLSGLQQELKLPKGEFRMFEWQDPIVTRVTEYVRGKGYVPYRVKGDLGSVEVTAVGELDNNEDWERIRNAVELEKWATLAYAQTRDEGVFIFSITRLRPKSIGILQLEAELSYDQLFDRLIEMRRIVEYSLGTDVRGYYFPEKVLHQFSGE